MRSTKEYILSLIAPILSSAAIIGCRQSDVMPTATITPTHLANPTVTEAAKVSTTSTSEPISTATESSNPLFSGAQALFDSIFAVSPEEGQWAVGSSLELWAIGPDGSTQLLARYTPFAHWWPQVTLSPDGETLAFGVGNGGALYYPYTGSYFQFQGVNVAENEPAAISHLAWSADSQILYYTVNFRAAAPQTWRISVDNLERPQLLAENLRVTEGGFELHPVAGLHDNRLLMEYYPTERSNAAIWNLETNSVTTLTYIDIPIHVWDTDGVQAIFDTGVGTSLLVGRFGEQGEIIDATEIQPLDMQASYSQAVFLPDGRIGAVWSYQTADPPAPRIVLLTSGVGGYFGTRLSPEIPAQASDLFYEIAVYNSRLIVEATDIETSQTVLSQVPLDGSPAIPLIEGIYQIVIP